MEPKWLIGGPTLPERVTEPQQDVQIQESKVSEGTYQGKTATQWREMAQQSYQTSQASFDRSDTDGALTQWANDTAARKYLMCAELAERDGLWEFQALFTLTGALVPDAVWIKTRPKDRASKWVWRIGTGQAVAWFHPSQAHCGARRRVNDAAKGYQLGLIRSRAHVASTGSGRGLSGAASVGFYIRQADDSPIEIVDNGSLGTQYPDH